MKPLTLTLAGIGPHESLTVNFPERGSLAILARYGSGKTFLLEAILHCLWGEGLWYPSTYDMLTQNGSGSGSIRCEFEHGGSKYSAYREISVAGKTRKQSAWLLKDGDQIAGPLVRDFEASIVALLGDFDAFAATCFLGQNRKGDLVGQPGEKDLVARRRAVFHSLIGADVLDRHAERFAAAASKVNGSIEELSAQLAASPDIEKATGEAEEAKGEATARKASADLALAAATDALQAAQDGFAQIKGDDAALRGRIEAHESAKSSHGMALRALDRLRAELNTARLKADGLPGARVDAGRLTATLADIDRLEGEQEAFDTRREWVSRETRIVDQLESVAREIGAHESRPGLDPATVALAKRRTLIEAAGLKAKAENDEISLRNANRANRRDELNLAVKCGEAEVKRLEDALAKQPETPFGTQCSPCQFMRDWAAIPETLKHCREALEKTRADLAAVPAEEPLQDLQPLRDDLARAKEAEKAVKTSEEARQALEVLRQEKTVAEKALAAHREGQPPAVDDPRQPLAEARQKARNLGGAPEILRGCEEATAKLDRLDAQHKTDGAEAERLATLAEERRPDAESAAEALKDREAERDRLALAVAEAKDRHDAARREAEEAASAVAVAEANIRALESRAAEIAGRRKRLAECQDRAEVLKDLRQWAGPKGVKQLLIEQAAPALEAIAADLFQRATGGKQALRISTLRPLANGGIEEDFSILVTDQRGERDATRFSGGQLQLIIVLFRIAVALWIGQLRGRRPDCLILDEAFDRLGADGSEDLLRVLESLEDQFGLIVYVTHDAGIASRAGNVFRLGSRGAEARVAEAETARSPFAYSLELRPFAEIENGAKG